MIRAVVANRTARIWGSGQGREPLARGGVGEADADARGEDDVSVVEDVASVRSGKDLDLHSMVELSRSLVEPAQTPIRVDRNGRALVGTSCMGRSKQNPALTIHAFTDSAHRSERPWLSSAVPRLSVKPVIRRAASIRVRLRPESLGRRRLTRSRRRLAPASPDHVPARC